MKLIRVYRLAYNNNKYMPQVGFRLKWLTWLPFPFYKWHYIVFNWEGVYDVTDYPNHYKESIKRLCSENIAVAYANLEAIQNHYNLIDFERAVLESEFRKHNKEKKFKIKEV